MLRGKAAFALKLSHIDGPLPHAKELKVQCGGMLGVEESLTHQPSELVDDIHTLLESAFAEYGNAESLPYSEVVRTITSFQPRNKR